MKVLVTGANGQLGSEWRKLSPDFSCEALFCTRAMLDLTDSAKTSSLLDREQPDVIVNCAAYTGVDSAEEEPGRAMAVNAQGVATLVEWCRRNQSKLIHYSTDYVFAGRMEDHHTYPDGYPEEAETDPINLYGESKRAGEKILINSGIDYLLIRVSWLCGTAGSNFVKSMLNAGQQKKDLRVVNDQLGSPTYTPEVVKLTEQLMKRNEQGMFHITSNGILSWYELAVEIFRYTEMDVNLEAVDSRNYPTKAARPRYSKLSAKKICETLRTEMSDWRTGLHRLIEQLEVDL